MLWYILLFMNIVSALLWGLIHGAARCRSAETIRRLDDEQMKILASMRGRNKNCL